MTTRLLPVLLLPVLLLAAPICSAQVGTVDGPLTIPSTPQRTGTLNNDAVVRMCRAGLDASIILQTVRTQPGRYATGPDDLISLKEAGVPQTVITAMMARGSGLAEHPDAANAIQVTQLSPGIDEEGVYRKDRDGKWVALAPELVHYKSGGWAKSTLTNNIVKKDRNGEVSGAQSPTVLHPGGRAGDCGSAEHRHDRVPAAALPAACEQPGVSGDDGRGLQLARRDRAGPGGDQAEPCGAAGVFVYGSGGYRRRRVRRLAAGRCERSRNCVCGKDLHLCDYSGQVARNPCQAGMCAVSLPSLLRGSLPSLLRSSLPSLFSAREVFCRFPLPAADERCSR